ncbi:MULTISPECIES: hypothetical protein [Nocardia]|uniref:hypothetical protein n=1 Tax=Nocardia TaxID=1817 RepID=UPI001895189E|nr:MULTISPECIES: hypothetical protein [Nocardia]MBF6350973.1 hypothetical protein [Nocardia flavorosea]
MGSDDQAREHYSVVQMLPVVAPRKLAKVPFVEMADGRLQGVVSSGSDIARVYVSSISAREHGLSCSTNNNRPCGGHSGGYACKHIRSLLAEAVLQYGIDRVARFLGVDVPADGDILGRLDTSGASTPAAVVFSRFLRHLSYLEQPGSTTPVPELHWFPAAGAPA